MNQMHRTTVSIITIKCKPLSLQHDGVLSSSKPGDGGIKVQRSVFLQAIGIIRRKKEFAIPSQEKEEAFCYILKWETDLSRKRPNQAVRGLFSFPSTNKIMKQEHSVQQQS